MRVVVAMSGGVDSSTAAGLLVEQGHEVIGLSMKTHEVDPCDTPAKHSACCTPDDLRDARRVADQLGIPFYVLNYTELFFEQVVQPFAEAYRAGRTPNPCIDCNDKVKFKPMLQRARLLGAEILVTGHYARTQVDSDGRVRLLRGRDSKKDQSYFLYRLQPEQLARIQFPLGNMRKEEVRGHAERFGLQVADKEESQEICFVGGAGYAALVDKISARPNPTGKIIGPDGAVLGEHAGVHRFTIGQRRGLGIAAATPLYVTRIDAAAGEVHVGPSHALLAEFVDVEALSWCSEPPELGEQVLVQQRYREQPVAAQVESLSNGSLRLRFAEPHTRGAPGQAAVLYRNDETLGGGIIADATEQA